MFEINKDAKNFVSRKVAHFACYVVTKDFKKFGVLVNAEEHHKLCKLFKIVSAVYYLQYDFEVLIHKLIERLVPH